MKRGTFIFLSLQVFFVVFGFALFFGLKALKESRAERKTVAGVSEWKAAGSGCDFHAWTGAAVNEDALKETGRPYRILPPGSMATMDYNPVRINVHTDDNDIVIKVACG